MAAKIVVVGMSGGVDSSVAAALVAEAVGSQLTCVFVDHGLCGSIPFEGTGI